MDFEEAMLVLAALQQERVEYVLVGSMGMAAHGLVRATRDLDLFISPRPENVSRLRNALKALYADPEVDAITAEDLGGDYPAIEYVPPHGKYSMDLLARLGEAFRYEDLEWEELFVDGICIRVATPRMLCRMKEATIRQQDRLDAEWLRSVFHLGATT